MPSNKNKGQVQVPQHGYEYFKRYKIKFSHRDVTFSFDEESTPPFYSRTSYKKS